VLNQIFFSRIIIGFLLGVAISIAQGRTLFIDFNNAESEIRVFRENVGGKRQEVVVLPSYERITPSQRATARKANTLIETYTSIALECATSIKVRVDRCDDVYAEIRRAELLRIKATGDYSANDLKAELRSLIAKEPSKKFDLLVISGHHDKGYYNGELTQARERDISLMLKESAIDLAQFNTIILLGCKTGTRDTYIRYLAPLFADVVLIFGAEDRAPTRDELRNLAFIRKLLSVRHSLLNAKTRKDVEPIYRDLLAERWPVSLLWNRQFLFFSQGVELI
jgi:hypothetical protein